MKRFKRVYIEITNICNLKCSYCPVTGRKPEYMDIAVFSDILEQIKPYTDHVYLHVKGEPLMHPALGEFLDICSEKGLMVNITTNGTLIGRVGKILLTKDALRQVSFSLHSFEGDWEDRRMKYINDILSFVKEANERTKIITSLRFWNLDKDNSVNAGRNRNRQMLEIIEKEFSLDNKIEERVLSSRGMKIADRVYVNQDYEFKWPDLKEDEDNGAGTCYGLVNQIAVLVDGTVVPCCLDGEGIIDLGNIKDISFRQILESERVKRIVKGFGERKVTEELCRKCDYRRRFGLKKI